jgi:predicted lipoprotein with Yx(FWY)xxD motif
MFGNLPVDAAATAAVAARSTSPKTAILRTRSSLSRVTGVATPSTRLRIALLAAVAAAVAVVAAGSGGSGAAKAGVAGARHVLKSATVTTRRINKLGVVLVNSRGLTLYMFKPDHQKRVTCKGSCAAAWPPLKVKSGQKPTAGGAAKQRLLGSDKNPSGGRVVTYNGWPLYRYIGDSKPGQASGQATNLNGGLWYVLSPSGKIITTRP